MNRDLLIAIIGVLVVAAAIAAFQWWLSGVKQKAYDDGVVAERNEWITKQIEWQAEKSALEAKNAEDVANADARRLKEVNDVRKERDAAIADRNRFRLRWLAKPAAPSPSPAPGADTSGAGQPQVCELPEQTRDDLIREAARANRLTADYNTLLEIARKDREVCK